MRLEPTKCLRTLLSLLVAGMFAAMVTGCGDDENVAPVQSQEGIGSVNDALTVQHLAASEQLLDAMENPLSSAAGNFDDLGTIGEVGSGETGVGSYWSASKQLASSASSWRSHAQVGMGTAYARTALRESFREIAARKGIECTTFELPNGQREECVEAIVGDVIRLTITQTNDTPDADGIISIVWIFEVDTKGNPETLDDDILSLETTVVLADGSVIETSIKPELPGPIEDGSLVLLTETITPTYGFVQSQTNTLIIDIGFADIDEDEVIWGLSSNIDFRSGATSSITVDELGVADGVRDNDQLELSASFTSPTADPRFDNITSTVWIDVAVLDDDNDDLFGFASRTVVLDGSTLAGGSPTVVESYDPDSWVREGEEPCSGTFSRTATFASDSDAQSISHVVTHDCQAGGSSALQVDFADASGYSQDITWDGAGVATLAATHRDGTTVAGSFDEAAGTFTLTTDFPQSHDPVQVVQSGSVIGTTRSYSVVATYVDQSTESLDITSELLLDGTRSVTATATDADGTSSFAAVFSPATGALAGSATGSDGGTIDFAITPQADGTRLFIFTANDPVEDVTVTGILVLQADGSGCGTITIRRGGSRLTVPVCFDADGNGDVDGDPVGA